METKTNQTKATYGSLSEENYVTFINRLIVKIGQFNEALNNFKEEINEDNADFVCIIEYLAKDVARKSYMLKHYNRLRDKIQGYVYEQGFLSADIERDADTKECEYELCRKFALETVTDYRTYLEGRLMYFSLMNSTCLITNALGIEEHNAMIQAIVEMKEYEDWLNYKIVK